MATPRGRRGERIVRVEAKPDRAAMAVAIEGFLRAAGLAVGEDVNLADTPQRVAKAWAEEFLDGYSHTPEEVLGTMFPVPLGSAGEMVLVTDLRFHSMCPHHLMPYAGTAHVAYVPARRVVGFGRLSALVDCFAHRLILQEELARQVAVSLAGAVGSPATACIIEAEQSCLRLRGSHQRDARTHVEAYEGRFREDGPLRRELWARLSMTKR